MTNKERLRFYEGFFHSISMAAQGHNNERVREAINIIVDWSYAHRCGNGELSDHEQQTMIDTQILNMREF